MSKKATAQDVAKAEEALNQIATRGDAPLKWEEIFDTLESADPALMQDLTSEYFSFDSHKGKTLYFAVMGMAEITIKNKQVLVAKVRDRDGNNFLIGDKVFVGACQRLEKLPAFVSVTYTEDRKSDAGSYKDFQIKTFPGS